MKRILLSLILIAVARAASAQSQTVSPPPNLGIGIVLGDPLGATAKYWLNSTQAVDAGLGVGDGGGAELSADYLFHGWNIFPQPSGGRIAGYAGVGGRVNTGGDLEGLGLRIPVGVTFMPNGASVELYAELVPVFVITDDTGADLEGGIGFRFYFNTRPRPS